MWQKFTERARRVIFFAQDEAGRLKENYVSTEHILLGLTREDDCRAALVLARLGATMADIRREIERQVAQGDGRLGGEMQLTPRAKRVFDLSYEEAQRIDNKYIGTEHLLLGLVREGEGLAGRVLSHRFGIDLERARREVVAIQQEAMKTEATADSVDVIDTRTPERTLTGDLGVACADDRRTHIEVALDAATFVELSNVFQARDAHGYRALAHGDQTLVLLPVGTPLKLLVPPGGGNTAVAMGGRYVRVLSGEYEGYAGWIFSEAFQREGPDDTPFHRNFEGQIRMKNENEAYEAMLCSHLEGMVYRLRQIPPEQFDFTFAPPAPSPRTLAIHAWQWLVCDRNHIAEPDASKHPRIPDPPADQQALCDVLAEETENWRQLIRSLTPEKMLEERRQFNQEYDHPLNIRWFIFHMIQNAVYKHGQMSTTYFALGLDGTEPYTAPFPNPIYEELFGPRPA